jgi:hypothetical protein
MREHRPCGRNGCSEPGIATFGAGTLCSEHFLVACYEVLGRLDRGMGLSARGASEASEAIRVADECVRGVLDVSLNAAELSNLQKARLLDVLLWASDIPDDWPARRSRTSNDPVWRGPQLPRALGHKHHP